MADYIKYVDGQTEIICWWLLIAAQGYIQLWMLYFHKQGIPLFTTHLYLEVPIQNLSSYYLYSTFKIWSKETLVARVCEHATGQTTYLVHSCDGGGKPPSAIWAWLTHWYFVTVTSPVYLWSLERKLPQTLVLLLKVKMTDNHLPLK